MSLLKATTVELEQLERDIRVGSRECPLSQESPSLEDLGARMPVLFGHSKEATLALISAILAERAVPHPRLELVWSGPDEKATLARDTAVVVAEMFRSAQRTVLVAGYAFDHGADILRPLFEVMRDRRVKAEFFLDVPRAQAPVTVEEAADHVMRYLDSFVDENWPFGKPEPDFYYDPRTVSGPTYASIHAKCVVVDERVSLIGSANFTNRGQERNVEVGVKIEDTPFAKALVRQWRQLEGNGRFRRGR